MRLVRLSGVALLAVFGLTLVSTSHSKAPEANTRGSTTGPTSAPGFSHPNQYAHVQPTSIADNMEPVIVHKSDVAAAKKKLKAMERKHGKKPNIVLFLTDDTGWMDYGFNGGGIAVGNPTPNIDALATEGTILTSAYSTPSCSPTRATIMTGQNPLHHGLLRPPMYGEDGGLDGAVTIAKILKDAGYTTQGVGKWHMGENQGSQPQSVGFDDYYGFLGVSDMYTEWRDVYLNPEIALSPERFQMMEQLAFSKSVVHCGAEGCVDQYLIDLESIKHLDQDWKDYSVKFIKEQAKSDKPFFLYHGTRGAHFDNYPSDEFAGSSLARTNYGDTIVELDAVFGEIVAALKKSGQLENTLIVFGSDNGPEQEVFPYGRSPFRGGKGSSWEGGVRVPTYVYWKDVIPARKTEGLFDYADMFNTFAALAGISGADLATKVPADRYIDGIDQTAFLLADEGQSARRSRIYTLNAHFSAVRVDEFKLHMIVELQDAVFNLGYKGGFSGVIVQETGGTTCTNLYTNPQEDMSIGVRHLPMLIPIGQEADRYAGVLKKYPPKIQIRMPGQN